MQIDVNEDGVIRLKEVFNSIVFETAEGVKLFVCMRDDGYEIGLVDDSIKCGPNEDCYYLNWWTAGPRGIHRLENTEQGDNSGD